MTGVQTCALPIYPGYQASTDHTREYTPFLMYGRKVEPENLGTRDTFADIGATVLRYFGIRPAFEGESMLPSRAGETLTPP